MRFLATKKIQVLAAVALFSVVFASGLSAASPDKTKYQTTPFLSDGTLVPEVLLVISKDHKMFQQAYNPLIDFDEDGFVDTGFNPSVIYYGYFDSYSCYQYSGSGTTNDGDINGYFHRVRATIDDEATVSRPSSSVLPNYIPSPRAVHHDRSSKKGEKIGICQMPGVTTNAAFSGNWLNFLTTSRMDVIRKVLYGGLRSTDTNTRTVLEGSMVPTDAHVWGIDVMSDDRWVLDTPQSVYYDISKYTPYQKPSAGKMHMFSRTRSFSSNNFPTVKYLLNASKASFQNQGQVPGRGRHWDWSLNERPNPKDSLLASSVRSQVRAFTVRVEVCKAGNISETEGCEQYPNGNFKPTGLLQKYGIGDQMYFGLLTGSFHDTTRIRGGVLRHHIASLGDAVSSVDGTIKKGSIIWTLDMLRITGRGDGSITDNSNYNYGHSASWGNPIGEMLFEAVRYFTETEDPTSAFVPSSEVAINPRGNPGYLKKWNNRPTRKNGADANKCPKPVILLISDIDSDFDGNDIPASNDLKQPVLSAIKSADAAKLPNFNVKTYLDRITDIELIPDSGGILRPGGRYFYSTGTADSCAAKTLTSLDDIKGICPNSPAFLGNYSVAAVAYYARTHDFFISSDSSVLQETGIDTYAVTMASAYPELSFPIKAGDGTVLKQISILPASGSDRSSETKNRVIGFINYFIEDWQTDKNGTPFRITITVNYEDAVRGADPNPCDWDMDVIATYTINLVTDATTDSSMRGPAIQIDSGDLKGTGTYYTFANPANIQSRGEMLDIKPEHIKGLVVKTQFIRQASGVHMALGYTISGTDGKDGTYFDATNNGNASVSPFNSPPACAYPGGPGCGNKHNTRTQFRSFRFSTAGPNDTGRHLPNPMWLAAKYGGFDDRNNNGVPDKGEWEGPDGNPKNYFQATNIAELPDQLEEAFKSIASGTSTGTATSASVNAILGGGISIQTLYYPVYKDHLNSQNKISWVGSVMGLFVDKWGNLREDNHNLSSPLSGKGDGIMTLKTGKPGDPGFPTGDFAIAFEPGGSTGPAIKRYYDESGTGDLKYYDEVSGYERIKAVWNVASQLSGINAANRKVYYGEPGGKSIKAFNVAAEADLKPFMIHDNTGYVTDSMLPNPNNGKSLIVNLIGYILGDDVEGWRSRQVSNPWSLASEMCDPQDPVKKANCITWRLGDILNSKPVIVAAPAANYDLIYNDESYYTDYKKLPEVSQRRNVAYFGANDGMLHAINLGFYGSLTDGHVGYKKKNSSDYELGEEMWSYIPTSVLPHLQWLADPNYVHSYYVDLKPLLTDMKIGGKWRTVLIGGLRLGGRSIESDGVPPYSYSEVFALDVTDPEVPPKPLWRYSADKLGLSVGLPVVATRNGKWYVILASGPNIPVNQPTSSYYGQSAQEARLIVIDPETGKEVVDTSLPAYSNYLKVPHSDSGGYSFFNESFLPRSKDKTSPWNHHAVYYGLTVNRDSHLDRGAVYRLNMTDNDPKNWELVRLYDTERPVTGAVNSTYDEKGNLWVLFGTGRLWWELDMRPCTGVSDVVKDDCTENHEQYIYGIKEPLDASGDMTFGDQSAGTIIDVSGAKVFNCSLQGNGFVTGLIPNQDPDLAAGPICGGSSKTGVMYSDLAAVIMSDTYIGYKRKLDTGNILGSGYAPRHEMILTQPKVDGLGNGQSFMAFTTFEPPQGTCSDSGKSYLHLVDTFTGLPAPYLYTSFLDPYMGNSLVEDDRQVPGYIEAGAGKSTEATITKTDEETSVNTSGQDGSMYGLKLPKNVSQVSSTISWREVLDMGFTMDADAMTEGLENN